MRDLLVLLESWANLSEALDEGSFARTIAVTENDFEPQEMQVWGRQLARSLRRMRSRRSLVVQYCLAVHHKSVELMETVRSYLSTSLLAVIGPAGCGKTHLAAEITSESEQRPSGVYIEAWPLTRRGTIDDLLSRLGHSRASSFRKLLEAVEAAGARSNVRIPVLIDGLNESEDPANWKDEVLRLQTLLTGLKHVIVVVTLRPSVANTALPSDCRKIELSGFGQFTDLAVNRYFEYYKISASEHVRSNRMFREPLFLRIFCEATNPDHDEWVTSESVPTSLTAVFEKYRSSIVTRIVERPGAKRRYQQDILNALDQIALRLWKKNARAISFNKLRKLISDDVEWTTSLAWQLEDEGILSRNVLRNGKQISFVLFDAFAGFLIADALTRQKGRNDFVRWLESGVIARLDASSGEAHPLASDICKALVGILPRRFYLQFWSLVDGSLRAQAILDVTELEARLIDSTTVAMVGRLVSEESRSVAIALIDRLQLTRHVVGHPLNMQFLDEVLHDLSVAERDLRWTERVRLTEEQVLAELASLSEMWKLRLTRTAEDHLQALWAKWVLTSTVRIVRDHATETLYWYGRGEPEKLFRLVVSSFESNDPYVVERLLAATYGVLMAAPGELRDFGAELKEFLDDSWGAVCDENASSSTDHWLIHEYVIGLVNIAKKYYPNSLGKWASSGDGFAPQSWPLAISHDDQRASDSDLVYGLDFRNYTVGRLVENRSNYDFKHPQYEEILSWIRGRVWELGWRSDLFRSVERQMRDSDYRRSDSPGRIETYKKKYGWIGFFEAAGRLERMDRLPVERYDDSNRLSDMNIDPSFPFKVGTLDLDLSEFISNDISDDEEWIASGKVGVSDEIFRISILDEEAGPWIALGGFLSRKNLDERRRVFGILQALLVRKDHASHLRTVLQAKAYPGNSWIPDGPSSYYCFAGEMPWVRSEVDVVSMTELRKRYIDVISGVDGSEITVEIPIHYYSWESYHSMLNQSGGLPLPARTFAEEFDLRAIPNCLDWCDNGGIRASQTCVSGAGYYKDQMVYLREDLMLSYCERYNYELVWMLWGERELHYADRPREIPDWLHKIYDADEHIWRRVMFLSEMTGT